jgi:hypothetical protein
LGVNLQFDFALLSAKSDVEVIKHPDLAQQVMTEMRSSETNPGRPFTPLLIVGKTQDDLRQANGAGRRSDAGSERDGSVGQVDADEGSNVFREGGIVRPGVNQSLIQ